MSADEKSMKISQSVKALYASACLIPSVMWQQDVVAQFGGTEPGESACVDWPYKSGQAGVA